MKIASRAINDIWGLRWSVIAVFASAAACSAPQKSVETLEYDFESAREAEPCDSQLCQKLHARTPVLIPAVFEIGPVETADILFDTWDKHVRIECTPRSEERWWSWRGIVMRCIDEGSTEFRFESVEAVEALEPFKTQEFIAECEKVRARPDPDRSKFFILLTDPITVNGVTVSSRDAFGFPPPSYPVENARFTIVYSNSHLQGESRASGGKTKREYVLTYSEVDPDRLENLHKPGAQPNVDLHPYGVQLPETKTRCGTTRYIPAQDAEEAE